MTAVDVDGLGADDAAQQLLARIRRAPARPSPPGRAPAPFVARPQPGERLRYVLEERVGELETRLRAADLAAEAHEREVRALQLEVALRAAYVSHLETVQGSLHEQLRAAGAERAGLVAELERLRAEVAQLGGTLEAMRRRRAYQLADRLARLVRRAARPLRAARRRARAVRA